jgi:hypothetical protein
MIAVPEKVMDDTGNDASTEPIAAELLPIAVIIPFLILMEVTCETPDSRADSPLPIPAEFNDPIAEILPLMMVRFPTIEKAVFSPRPDSSTTGKAYGIEYSTRNDNSGNI